MHIDLAEGTPPLDSLPPFMGRLVLRRGEQHILSALAEQPPLPGQRVLWRLWWRTPEQVCSIRLVTSLRGVIAAAKLLESGADTRALSLATERL